MHVAHLVLNVRLVVTMTRFIRNVGYIARRDIQTATGTYAVCMLLSSLLVATEQHQNVHLLAERYLRSIRPNILVARLCDRQLRGTQLLRA